MVTQGFYDPRYSVLTEEDLMDRCATCKHWHPFQPGEYDAVQQDDPRVRNKLGLCCRIGMTDQYRPDYGSRHSLSTYEAKETIALVEDLSSECGLRTAANFGCVLHEAKEST
jgi:hypothetical protein